MVQQRFKIHEAKTSNLFIFISKEKLKIYSHIVNSVTFPYLPFLSSEYKKCQSFPFKLKIIYISIKIIKTYIDTWKFSLFLLLFNLVVLLLFKEYGKAMSFGKKYIQYKYI